MGGGLTRGQEFTARLHILHHTHIHEICTPLCLHGHLSWICHLLHVLKATGVKGQEGGKRLTGAKVKREGKGKSRADKYGRGTPLAILGPCSSGNCSNCHETFRKWPSSTTPTTAAFDLLHRDNLSDPSWYRLAGRAHQQHSVCVCVLVCYQLN